MIYDFEVPHTKTKSRKTESHTHARHACVVSAERVELDAEPSSVTGDHNPGRNKDFQTKRR